MAKVFAICGKICSGKTVYANKIKTQENAVVLSCDELTNILFDNNLGEKHDEIMKKVQKYLFQKTAEIVSLGLNVVPDWGFWTKNDRNWFSEYFENCGVSYELHYLEVDDETWNKNIEKRNKDICEGKNTLDFFVDKGLKQKMLSMWEEPKMSEIDVWIKQNQ